MATKTYDIKDSDKMFESIGLDFKAITLGIVTELQERIIDKAPKESGALRNSIRVGVNGENIIYDKGTFSDGVKAENASTLRSEFEMGDTVSIVVGAPYGQKMEQGASDQAPTGFMSSAAEELPSILQQVESQFMTYRKE